MINTIETYIVDSFTNQPFKGNPAGVVIVDRILEDQQMLSISKEFGFSETAFIKNEGTKSHYSIRFFSPIMEIPLCGHASLASAKVIFERDPEIKKIWFKNIQGLSLEIKEIDGLIEMIFPVYDTSPQNAPIELLAALGIERINNSVYNAETKILLLEIASNDILRNLSPNFEELMKSHNQINGVLVTSISDNKSYDFESRYFWPWSGTNEDPVTGGTHTFLAKYWSTRLNKLKMRSFQCSERSGFMDVEILDNKTMCIKSDAQIILKGELRINY